MESTSQPQNNNMASGTINYSWNVPDYASARSLLTRTTTASISESGTVQNDGFIQSYVRVGATPGAPFMRIFINGNMVYEDADRVSAAYHYKWSPHFPVKAGDTYQFNLDGSGVEYTGEIRYYGIRN